LDSYLFIYFFLFFCPFSFSYLKHALILLLLILIDLTILVLHVINSLSYYKFGGYTQAVDIQKLTEVSCYVHYIWSTPYQCAISILLLFQVLGWPAAAGLAVKNLYQNKKMEKKK